MRAIVTPPVLPPEALAELKLWLGITTARDDAPLVALLHAAIDMCAAFTGVMPLACTCEETLGVRSCWQVLTTKPVLAMTTAERIDSQGNRTALASEAFAFELDADGSGRVRVFSPVAGDRIVVRLVAGLAATWPQLPEALRQGIVRLAAHQHRERESSGSGPIPPASVAALWRPWRQVRLA